MNDFCMGGIIKSCDAQNCIVGRFHLILYIYVYNILYIPNYSNCTPDAFLSYIALALHLHTIFMMKRDRRQIDIGI